MNIQEIRQKYPQYNDVSDEDLVRGLHQKYYNDIPIEEFSKKVGLTNTKPEESTWDKVVSGTENFIDSAESAVKKRTLGTMQTISDLPVMRKIVPDAIKDDMAIQAQVYLKNKSPGVTGFSGEVLGDPLTYLPLPGGPVAKNTVFGGIYGLTNPRPERNMDERMKARAIDAAQSGVVGGVTGKVLSKIPTSKKEVVDIAERGTNSVLEKLAPKAINEAAILASEKTGIPLPPSAKIPSRMTKFLEARSAQSGLAGETWEKLTKNIDDSTVKYVDTVLDDISPSKSTPLEIGLITQKAITNRQRAAQRFTRSAYGEVLDKYGSIKVDPTNTITYLDTVIPQLEKTLIPSTAKTSTINTLKTMRENIAKKPDVETLINTKADLSDIASFETVGGVKKFLNPLSSTIEKDIKAVNPDLGTAFESAKGLAQNSIVNLRNDLIQSITGAKSPEIVLSRIKNPSDVLKLENAAGNSPKMRNVIQRLKRAKLEEILTDKFIKEAGKDGRIEFGRASNLISKEEEMIRALAGEGNLQKLNALKTVANAITDSKSFYNFSKSGNVVQDIGLLTTGIMGTFTGNPAALAATASPYVAAKLLTNEKLMNKMIKLSREAKLYKRKPNLQTKKRGDILVNSIMQELYDSTKQDGN